MTSVVGQPCGVGFRAPRLRATPPRLGRPLTFRGTGSPANTPGVLFLGDVAEPPLPLGGDCVSQIGGTNLALAHRITAPSWSWTLVVPNIAALRGLTVAAQAWFAPSPTQIGGELSNGLHLTFGQ